MKDHLVGKTIFLSRRLPADHADSCLTEYVGTGVLRYPIWRIETCFRGHTFTLGFAQAIPRDPSNPNGWPIPKTYPTPRLVLDFPEHKQIEKPREIDPNPNRWFERD